jgi:tRNA1(Val) A37 N6-methylase TrmN6
MPPDELTLDGLTRDFQIWQRRRGHRHSTDDWMTAWYAVQHAPEHPKKLLDLGSGIGSIGLALLWHFRDAALTAIEAQKVSFDLLEKNIAHNHVGERARAIHGDLRHAVPAETSETQSFDLVTGSPPYFPPSTGIVSEDSQRAAARFELHGDVFDYCRAAKRALAPGGVFVFCFPSAQRARAERACADASLRIRSSRDVVPKKGLDPLFSLFACGDGGERRDEPAFVVRDDNGDQTAELTAARSVFF